MILAKLAVMFLSGLACGMAVADLVWQRRWREQQERQRLVDVGNQKHATEILDTLNRTLAETMILMGERDMWRDRSQRVTAGQATEN